MSVIEQIYRSCVERSGCGEPSIRRSQSPPAHPANEYLQQILQTLSRIPQLAARVSRD